jgi:hypothetical protein
MSLVDLVWLAPSATVAAVTAYALCVRGAIRAGEHRRAGERARAAASAAAAVLAAAALTALVVAGLTAMIAAR